MENFLHVLTNIAHSVAAYYCIESLTLVFFLTRIKAHKFISKIRLRIITEIQYIDKYVRNSN